MQPNDVGMDELMTFCKLINVEPYITVNAGLGDDHSAADLLEYANGSVQTRMGALRAKNGHSEPYHIKFWNVGNEPYGIWQVGFTPLRYWVIKHNLFVKAMRKVDPSITILASGAMPDEMTINGIARVTTGKLVAEFGTEGDWTGTVIEKCWGNFDAVTEHWYQRNGLRFDLDLKNDLYQGGTHLPPRYGYVPRENESLGEWTRHPSNRVRIKAEEWEEYKKRFPAIVDKKIFMSMDEWAYTGTPTNLKLALSYSLVMQEIFRHTDFLKMSAFTMGVSTIDYNATDSVFNTTGLMFKLYRDHFGTLPVEVTGNSPQPTPKWPVGGDQPKVNAGSPTYPLDMVAALTADKKFLTIAVVNPTESAQQLELNLQGVQVGGQPKMWQMTGPNADAANVVGQKPQVQTTEKQLSEIPKSVSVDPISVNIYSFPIQ
jgi:alpha-N-arabinofuranosidase